MSTEDYSRRLTHFHTRIAIRDSKTTVLGRYELTREQWRAIVSAESRSQWKFTRKAIGKAGVFRSLSTRLPEIRDEFLRLDMIYADENDDYYFTESGKQKLCEVAGLKPYKA